MAAKGRGYLSKHLLADSVALFYKDSDLFPKGLDAGLPAVADWTAKQGVALARLVTWACWEVLGVAV